MATSEPLVPKGLPQGERQNVRAGMQRAGIPLAPPSRGPVNGTPTIPGRSGASPLDLLAGSSPTDFPFLADREVPLADLPPEQAGSVTDALMASAQSDFARAVSARLARGL